MAFNESIAPVQENSHGSYQENWKEGIPLGAVLWSGTHWDWGVGAHAKNGQDAVQICSSAAKDGTSNPHTTHYKVKYRKDVLFWGFV